MSRMRFRRLFVLCAMLACASALPTTARAADNFMVYPGTSCVPELNYYNDAYYENATGIVKNQSNGSDRVFICPVTRRETSCANMGDDDHWVVAFNATPYTEVTCYLYLRNAMTGSAVASDPDSTNYHDGRKEDLRMNDLGTLDVDYGAVFYRCILPKRDSTYYSGIVAYGVKEDC